MQVARLGLVNQCRISLNRKMIVQLAKILLTLVLLYEVRSYMILGRVCPC